MLSMQEATSKSWTAIREVKVDSVDSASEGQVLSVRTMAKYS